MSDITIQKDQTAQDILTALAAPFDQDEIKFKPAVVSGNRAMALAYVDARVIQDRLDDVLGIDNWQDEYAVQDGGSVICKLSCRINGEWIGKMDVGNPSEQPDEGDRLKAAFSDALKRAAIKFGVGRFLYRLPNQWVDWDAQKKQFARKPTLPASLYSPTVKAQGERLKVTPPQDAPTKRKYIGDEEMKALEALLIDSGADVAKFYQWATEANTERQFVDALSKIPLSLLPKAETLLRSKIAQRKKEGGAA